MERRKRWGAAAAAAGALAILLPGTAVAQDGAEVLRTAMDRYESRLEGIETVTIVQETQMPMGAPTTSESRLVKRTVDGRPVLVPEGDSASNRLPMTQFYASLDEVTERATLRGRSTVDGAEAHVVHLSGLQDVDLGAESMSGDRERNFEADSATVYVGTGRYLVLRAEMHGRMSMAGSERSVSVRADFRDYRESDGFVYPYVTETRIQVEGLGAQMQAMMEKMQQAVRDSAQKAMMQRAAAAMSDDGMQLVTRVREVRVNEASRSGGG